MAGGGSGLRRSGYEREAVSEAGTVTWSDEVATGTHRIDRKSVV